MNWRHWLELAFGVIILGDILMHPNGFQQVITASSAGYNNVVKTFEGR